MKKTINNAGNAFTLETCLLFSEVGINCVWNDGKDLTLIDKEKDLPSGNLERSNGLKNIIITVIISHFRR